MNDDLNASPAKRWLQSAVILAGLIAVASVLLLPAAVSRTGSGGVWGLGIAAGVCLAAGWVAEGLAVALGRSVSPLGLMLLSMAVRMAPPLAICLILAAQRASGREHLAFICYLLTFYLVTLALETWLTVKRVAGGSPNLKPIVR
jgi:hypothetical protein